MLYLVDASALITAHNTFLALDRVPEYWDWLLHHGELGNIKLPREIYQEVEDGTDDLAAWMRLRETRDCLRLGEEPDPAHLITVTNCYGQNLTEADVALIGKDPFLVAAAMPLRADRTVVTSEVSKSSRTGPRRHVPDICTDCGVIWINPVRMIRELDFTTSWRNGA